MSFDGYDEFQEITELYVYVDDSGRCAVLPIERWETSDLSNLEHLINAELQDRHWRTVDDGESYEPAEYDDEV